MSNAKTLERLKSRGPRAVVKRSMPPHIQVLLDTDLFIKLYIGTISIVLILKTTQYIVRIPLSNDVPPGLKIRWDILGGYEEGRGVTYLEEILEEVSDEVAEKLVFHLDILPR